MNWMIIVILVVLAFFFLRIRHIKHKIYLVLIILVLLFVYVTASQVLSSHEFDWKSSSDIGTAAKIYFNWLFSIGDNFKELAGKAIDMDWKLNQTTK